MTKLVVEKIRSHAASGAKAQTVRDAGGKAHRVRIVDVNSATFSDDLLAAFRSNVSRARRQQKQAPIAAE